MSGNDDTQKAVRKKSRPRRPKQRYGLFEFVVGGVCCVVLPGLMTAVAPVSWLQFTRIDNQVHAETRTCVFFYIPYHIQRLENVKRVSTAFRVGDEIRRRPGDTGNRGRSESEGKVLLHGPEENGQPVETISVSVSPASNESVKAKIEEFLAAHQRQALTLFTVANWKFGLIFAIPMCLLTALFVVGWTIWLGQLLLSPFVKLLSNNTPEPPNGDQEST